MLTINKDKTRREQVEFISVDQLVPEDHLVRKIEKVINFDFIYDLVKDMYCLDNGRPSIDPVVLIKIVLIQYMFGIKSMRQTIKEIETNVAYRWFLGFGLTDNIPHFSTFSKNYERRFKGTNLFEKIFKKVLQQAIEYGLVNIDAVFIDSTHIKANANKKKYEKVFIEEQTKTYKEALEKEINEDRENHGLKPLDFENENVKMKEVKRSTTDPDSGMINKNEKEHQFGFSLHTACDKNGMILGTILTAANVHDSVMFVNILNEVEKNVGRPRAVAVDAGYKTPHICKELLDRNILPSMPYKRPQHKEGYFPKKEFVYDEYYDCYICPNNQILEYATTNRDGYRVYKSNPEVCKNCPYLSMCTSSKNQTKIVNRHVWEGYLEEVEHLRHTYECKELYKDRSKTIERVFADLKEKHGLRWTTLRGIEKVSMQAMLVCACFNLKKMANWMWKKGQNGPGKGKNFFEFIKYLSKILVKILKPHFSFFEKWGLSTV